MKKISDIILERIFGMERVKGPKWYPKPEQSPEEKAERLAAAEAKRMRRQERNWRNALGSDLNNPTLHNKE